VRNNKGYVLEEKHLTLAERLKAAGYRTGGVVSSLVLAHTTGIAQGFDHYDDPGPRPDRPRVFAQSRGDASVRQARRWLDGVGAAEPFFVFLHLFEPHSPYAPPEPFAARFAGRPYDGEVAYADQLVGEFVAYLKERGFYDRALVVFLSDHGEGLGDHVEQEHGIFLYREALQVPLLAKLPGGARRGERRAEPVGLFDVVPTVLTLLGLDAAGLPGRALLAGGAPAAGRPLYAETWFPREQYGWSELRSVILDDGHFVQAPKPELYDLRRDPAEKTNLLPGRSVPPAAQAAIAAAGVGKAATRAVSREEEERLAALGYLGGPGGADEGLTGALPDAKDHVADAVALWAAMEKVGKTDSLEPELRVKELLASLGLRREYLARIVATNLLKAGRPQVAAEVLAPYAASEEASTHLVAGEAFTAMGRLGLARQRFETALRQEPENPTAHRDMGILLLTAGRAAEARPWLERAVAGDPSSAEAWNALGVVRARAGDVAGAVLAWQKSVERDPGLGDAWFNLALGLRRQGDARGAAEALERYLPLARGPERARAEALLRELRRG
jgi:arylsulfatase A-like enzyme/Flp pilus assembly protein TadD